jgi:hypothetical protein
MDEIGILPVYQGRIMRDRLSSYDHDACSHSICGVHLLRDLTAVFERTKQKWARTLKRVLIAMNRLAWYWREQGATAVPKPIRDRWVARYFRVLAAGFAAQPPPVMKEPQKRGPAKQSEAKNLLDALLHRADQVLAFLDDLSIPFTNDLVAYCTPSARSTCCLRDVNILLRSMFVRWREQGNPTTIGQMHGNAASSPPIPNGLWGHSIGLRGFTGG